jgi:hypothetical protein
MLSVKVVIPAKTGNQIRYWMPDQSLPGLDPGPA